MPKHTEQTKANAINLLRKGLSIPTVAAKTNLPKSTLNLWKKELAANFNSETMNLEKLVPEQKIISRYSTEIERRFITQLSSVLDRIDLTAINSAHLDEAISPRPRLQTTITTDHYFIKDFNAFYDAKEGNLADSLIKASNLVRTVASTGSTTDIHLHFIGDHLNVGSFYIKKMEEFEQYEVFVSVLKALSQTIHSVALSNPNANVAFTVHGADFRSSMLNYILNGQIVSAYKECPFIVLSGLKAKAKEDDHILRSTQLNNPKIFYTDLQSIELGPEKFSLGAFNIREGIVSVRASQATKSINLNIVRW